MHAESSEHFCTACGLAGGLRISLRRPDVPEPEELVLERPFAMLGASPANDVVLDHAAVSRRHAYLQAVAGRVYCIDLGSRTGLVWDRQIRPSGWVGAGEEVFIGPFRFTTSASPAASPVAPDPAEGWDPLHTRIKEGERMPALVLEMDSAGYKRTRWQLSRVLALVGRDRGCKLWLAAESVSAFHCSLVGTPGGVWVVDLLSREGTYVNGNRVAFRRLEDGDRLRVGRVQIRAWYDSISGGASGTALAPAAEPAPPPPPARRSRPGRPAARPPARG
ncbi:MAG TPA: FHA domain-containing protein, partial [Gemmataceae bacterium]